MLICITFPTPDHTEPLGEAVPTRTVTDKTLASPLVAGVIDELAGNLTQMHSWASDWTRRSKKQRAPIDAMLESFARQVATMAMTTSPTKPDFNSESWKNDWANSSVGTAIDAGVEELVDQTLATIIRRFPHRAVQADSGFAPYGLLKVVTYVAQASRLISLGLSPEILLMTDEEGSRSVLRQAVTLAAQGADVTLIEV